MVIGSKWGKVGVGAWLEINDGQLECSLVPFWGLRCLMNGAVIPGVDACGVLSRGSLVCGGGVWG